MRSGYTLVEILAVLIIMALGAAVAGASIPWPGGGPARPADEYRRLLLRSHQRALANAGRVALRLETDGTYVVRSTSLPGDTLEAGRIGSCQSRLRLVRPARYAFGPGGLIVGDTLNIVCGRDEAIVYADAIAGLIRVEF